MKITNQQIASIHGAMEPKLKADKELKASVIVQFTKDETKRSTKNLTFDQANELLVCLGRSRHTKKAINKYGYFDSKNKQHMYLLSLCRQIGWTTYKQGMGMIADIDLFGDWLQNTGYLKKPLKKYNEKELPKLVVQFEKVVKAQK